MHNKNIILPNAITLLSLLCGIYAIIVSVNGRFLSAASLIILASIFDGLDGKVARLVKASSEFGVQMDSLCDAVSFGVAPAILMYNYQLHQYGKLGIMITFMFAACGVLRLARFNVQTKVVSNVFFVGLPIPGAAMVVASGIYFISSLGIESYKYLPAFSIVIMAFLSFLMVSTIPYFSFKNIRFVKTRPFNTMVFLVIFLVFIGIDPTVHIFIVLMMYIISGFFFIPLRQRILRKLEGEVENG